MSDGPLTISSTSTTISTSISRLQQVQQFLRVEAVPSVLPPAGAAIAAATAAAASIGRGRRDPPQHLADSLVEDEAGEGGVIRGDGGCRGRLASSGCVGRSCAGCCCWGWGRRGG